MPLGQHARQERLDRAMHRLDVEIKREVPVLVAAIEDGTVMHKARRIDQNVDRADLLGKRIHGPVRQNIEFAALCPGETFKLVGVAVRRPDGCTFPHKGFRNGAPDALSCRSHNCDFTLQPSRHDQSPVVCVLKSESFRRWRPSVSKLSG